MTSLHEQIVRNFLTLFNTDRLDMDRMRAALSPEATYQPLMPLSKKIIGAAAVCGELERQWQHYSFCDCVIINIASNDRIVFTERHDKSRQPDGRPDTCVNATGLFAFDDDDRIISWREYWDTLDVGRQKGITPARMEEIMQLAPA